MQRLKRMTAWNSYAEQCEICHVFEVAGPPSPDQDVMELRIEDDIGPYKRHELLTGKIYYPALGYSGYGDGKSTHIADFVNQEMRAWTGSPTEAGC